MRDLNRKSQTEFSDELELGDQRLHLRPRSVNKGRVPNGIEILDGALQA